jgi:hypothetical protein
MKGERLKLDLRIKVLGLEVPIHPSSFTLHLSTEQVLHILAGQGFNKSGLIGNNITGQCPFFLL